MANFADAAKKINSQLTVCVQEYTVTQCKNLLYYLQCNFFLLVF